MDVKDKILVDIQENKKYKDLDIVGFSGGDANIIRNILSKYDDDFKRMANGKFFL
jgi:hypothetical protein|nr:MAG TPA: Ribosome-60S, ribosome biogenesis, LSU processome.7A [Bacteriophage sp.]